MHSTAINTPNNAQSDCASEKAQEDHSELMEIEELTNELKRLLVKHEAAIDNEGVRHEVETLERWMESYRRGLAAKEKLAHTGMAWLTDLRDRLKLSVDEIQRLEGEGGNLPPDKQQSERMEDLLKAVKRIDKVLPDIEQKLNAHHKEAEHA